MGIKCPRPMSCLNFSFLFYYFYIAFHNEEREEVTFFLLSYIIQWEPHSRLCLSDVNIHPWSLLSRCLVSASWYFLEDHSIAGKSHKQVALVYFYR